MTQSETSSTQATLAERFPLRILIVDDEPVNRKLVSSMLGKLGYTADTAQNGFEAVQMAEKTLYQIIFMDIMMPEMDGIEATQKILAHAVDEQRPVVIALSAADLNSVKAKCFEVGMEDFIRKPVLKKDFETAIEKWGSTTQSPVARIHLGELLSRVEFDRDVLRDLVGTFKDEFPQFVARLEEAVRAGDEELITQLCTKLKGMCLSMSIPRLYQLACEVEILSVNEDLDKAHQTIGKLSEGYQYVCSALNQEGLISP